jgi:hypothetical protein
MAAPKKSSKPATKAVKSLPKKTAKGADAVKGGAIRMSAGTHNHNQTLLAGR